MTPDQWTTDGYHPLVACLAAIWLIWKTHDAIADTRLLIRTMWRRRHKPLTPTEDDVTRITSSYWPPPANSPRSPARPRTCRGRPGTGSAPRP